MTAVTLPGHPAPALPPGADAGGGGRPFPLVRHSLSLAHRTILRIRRTPEQLLDVTLQPILFIVLFVYLFGGAISGSTHAYLQYVLPGLMVQTVLFSSMTIGDVVRYLISIVVIIAFGYAIGFRVQTDAAQTALAGLVLVVFSLCLCWVSVLIGMVVREPGGVQGISFMLMFPLTFGSNMFVPVDTMPGWLQAWVSVNPVTHLTETVRGLMIGGPVAWPLVQTLLWAAAILAVFAPLAVRSYRRRA